MLRINCGVNAATALFAIMVIASSATFAASSELCNEILRRNGAFNLIVKDTSKSAREFTYEWLRTATWQEFKKKQDAGLKVVLPIDGVPIEVDGTYTEEAFRKFTQLRNQGKLRNFSDDEFERSVVLTASSTISQDWLECMKINQDPKGMTCWGESNDRLKNGLVVYKARYFTDSKLNNTEPKVPKRGGLYVDGGEVIQPSPLGPGDKIPFGGVSVSIKRKHTSKVTIALNSVQHGSCNTVTFPAISDEEPPSFNVQTFSKTSSIHQHPQITVGLPEGYKLIGGGALVNWHGNGNLLVSSYPNGEAWTAQSKDHMHTDASTITAWAIGLEDPKDQWEVKTVPKSIVTTEGVVGIVTTDDLPPGFSRTGGGAKSEPSGHGRLLTASHPNASLAWSASDKDHEGGNQQGGELTAYVIGVKSRVGSTPQVQALMKTGASAQHPTGSSSLDPGYILTGGGARTSCALGNLLTGSYPIDSKTWAAEAKDHDDECPSIIDVWVVGLKHPPGSLSVEGGGPKLHEVNNFIGNWGIVPGAMPAHRMMAGGATVSKSTYYISQQGDTFLTLALRFYGTNEWKKLSDANPEVAKAAASPLLTPGLKILLPGI